MRPGGLIWGLEGRLEAQRDDLKPGGLIRGQEGRFEVRRADLRAYFRAWRAKIKPESADLEPQWPSGEMDGWTEGRTSGNSPLCPTGHRPIGAAAQKGGEVTP